MRIENELACFHCWHCGWSGGVRDNSFSGSGRRSQAARGISRTTLERLGVASGTAFFPELARKAPALFFRYRDGWKARAFPDKAFVANKGFKLSFWNEDAVLAANPDTVFITEGNRTPARWWKPALMPIGCFRFRTAPLSVATTSRPRLSLRRGGPCARPESRQTFRLVRRSRPARAVAALGHGPHSRRRTVLVCGMAGRLQGRKRPAAHGRRKGAPRAGH